MTRIRLDLTNTTFCELVNHAKRISLYKLTDNDTDVRLQLTVLFLILTP